VLALAAMTGLLASCGGDSPAAAPTLPTATILPTTVPTTPPPTTAPTTASDATTGRPSASGSAASSSATSTSDTGDAGTDSTEDQAGPDTTSGSSGSTSTSTGGRTTSENGGASEGTRYTVRDGDTLYSIAGRLGVSVDALARANGVSDPSRIRAGQTLVVPQTSGGSTGSATAG
jgi:LysM repeat protein